MSAILIKNASDITYKNLGRYVTVEMESGKHSTIVVVTETYVRVIVQNAANRCWRGLGKQYRSADEACAAYKTAEIRAMIAHAVEMSKAQPA